MTGDIRCPRWDCGRVNPAVNAFCYYCGSPLFDWQRTAHQPLTPPASSPVRASLKLPDNREISLDVQAQWIGRDDLNGIVSENGMNYISRRHFVISLENGRYYVEDQESANGTRLNGTEIKGKGKFELNGGDLIEVADVVALGFKIS
jgi:pSer/pThr/pTyr-binding forkhead associated (FHA) protein